jgi:hypothetical protein
MVSSCTLGLSCFGQGTVVESGELNNELLRSTQDGEFIQGRNKGPAAAQGTSL